MSSLPIYNRRRHTRYKSKHSNSWIPKVILGALAVLVFGSLLAVIGGVAFSAMTVMNLYADYAKNLPEPEKVSQQAATQFKTTKIYDRNGKVVLYELFDPPAGIARM